MATGTEIAIVGMAGRFPGASNVQKFWDVLRAGQEPIKSNDKSNGHEAIIDHTRAHWVKVNSLLPGVEFFDASFFGFSPREAETMDPQHRIFLECAWEAIEDAGYVVGDRARQVGVFAGASLSGYIFPQIGPNSHLLESLPAMIGNDKDYLATRTSYKLNLSGPSITVQTACSTSLVAVHLACQSLIAGECEAALAGGVSVTVPRVDRYYYLPGAILSPDGRCRAFDAKAHGTAFGEGVGAVLLMRLEDALRDRHTIYAVILGSAVNNDASLKAGYTAPSVDGQMQVIRQAQAVAGVEPCDISFIEAHGTGTVLGDAVELAALSRVFRASTAEYRRCALGSLKSNIGHLSTASGVAGLIKTALALRHRVIPPSINFETPNPDFDVATSPFFVNTEALVWDWRGHEKRRAGVSSFGVGGTNGHVVLEEAPSPRCTPSRRSLHVLPVSAKTQAALDHSVVNLSYFLAEAGGTEVADVAATQQLGRRAFDYRRAVVCQSVDDAYVRLKHPDPVHVSSGRACAHPSVAFMFPGQGTQYFGMSSELYRDELSFRKCVDECSDALRHVLGLDLRDVLYGRGGQGNGSAYSLQDTSIAQPALFVIEYALSQLLQSWGVHPTILIGHSIGEYVAACVAGVFSLEEALRIVAVRGRLMQSVEPGSMLSIALGPEELAANLNGRLDLAAINSPRNCVVSGNTDSVNELERMMVSSGVACRQLFTSHAFHSKMMEPILDEFTEIFRSVRLSRPRVPYISNLTGDVISDNDLDDPRYWGRQLRSPVLFCRGIDTVLTRGANVLLEVGPGRSLSALADHCGVRSKGVDVIETMPEARSNQLGSAQLMRALAGLWVSGVPIDWQALYPDDKRNRISLPTYPFERQAYWTKFEFSQPSVNQPGKIPEVGDWFYAIKWKRISSRAPQSIEILPSGRRIVVFADGSGLGNEISTKLREKGHNVVTVNLGNEFTKTGVGTYVISGDKEEQYRMLMEELVAEHAIPEQVIHLWSMNSCSGLPDSPANFLDQQDMGLYSLLRCLEALESSGCSDLIRFDIVTQGLFDVTGSEPLAPTNAPLLAFNKVVPQEHHKVKSRVIDICVSGDGENSNWPSVAEQLIEVLDCVTAQTTLAMRNRYWWEQTSERVDTGRHANSSRLKDQGIYLITGGLGKIGLALAQHIAARCHAKLVLTGRSGVPSRSEWESLLEKETVSAELKYKLRGLLACERAGGEVYPLQANVASEAEMSSVLRFVKERFGRLDGVVFAAGRTNLQRRTFQVTDENDYESHFESKVYGLLVLEKLLRHENLDFVFVISSLSTVLGGLAHLAYSSANHFSDAFVARQNRGCKDVWTTSDWDGWRFNDLDDSETAMQAAFSRYAMSPEEGQVAFDVLVSMPAATQWVISTGDLETRMRDWLDPGSSLMEEEKERAARVYERPHLANPYLMPEGALETRLAEIWQKALGVDRIGRDDDFFELGGHSLVAIQALARVREAFGVDLPIDRAFEASTLRKAAAAIGDLLTAKVEALTDEEAEELLKRT